ncbi:MAG: hypothetical protein ACQEXJ_06195 [Myxococcota bacterium]
MGPLLLGLLAGCVEEHPRANELMSFEVSLAGEQATGTDEEPLEYVAGGLCAGDSDCPDGQACSPTGVCAMRLTFDVQAIGRDGHPFPYRGPIHMRFTPGAVADSSQVMMMDGGRAEGVEVHVMRGIGRSHVWFEADGYLPRPDGQDYSQCSDGIDNDLDGRIDMADPGCQDPTDDLEAPVGLATGVSPTLWFDDPRIRDIQHTEALSTSPLEGQQVQVTAGTLVVTNVVANGFYVVDLQDNVGDRLFNSLFVFTFSKPKGIDFGDTVCGVSGAVQEHVGQTQVVFPSFEPYHPDNPACEDFPGLDPDAEVPDPWDVTDDLAAEDRTSPSYLEDVYANSKLLERYEGNLVTFRNVAVSERFIACDRDGNGTISFGPEDTCRDACQEDPLCSDLEGYFEFSQYAGVVDGKKKIYGSIALADEFEPLDIDYIGGPDLQGRCELAPTDDGFVQYVCPPLTLESLTGSLRHIYLCGEGSDETQCDLQFWVIDPRFDGDVQVAE